MNLRRARFLKNAAVISLGGLFAKVIGVFYRIPLANLLGGYGMGLYQMAYPLFCLLLTFSSAGIPAALARMVAREEAAGRAGKRSSDGALRLFFCVGLSAAVLMCLIAPGMSRLQGEAALLPAYLALAPSVLLVALLAVLRGYFQGKSDMKPTAFSEIVEQLVKACAGLCLAQRFSSDPVRAVTGALFAVTLSETAALGALWIRYRRERSVPDLRKLRGAGEVFFSVFSVMAAAAILPLSQMADSVTIIRLLGGGKEAIVRYGLFAGSALALAGLPATACSGLSAASVPLLSGGGTDAKEGERRALFSLCATLALALPCAAGLLCFARPIVSLLYPSLDGAERALLIDLLRLLSVSALALAGTETLAACLTGLGRARRAALAMLIAVLIKFFLQCLLVPRFSVLGAAIAANGCYLVAFFLDLFYTVTKKQGRRYDHNHRIGNGKGGREQPRDRSDETRGQSACAERIACLRGEFAGGGH